MKLQLKIHAEEWVKEAIPRDVPSSGVLDWRIPLKYCHFTSVPLATT